MAGPQTVERGCSNRIMRPSLRDIKAYLYFFNNTVLIWLKTLGMAEQRDIPECLDSELAF